MSTAGTFTPTLCLLGRFTLTYGPTTLDVGTAAQRLLAYLGLRHHGTRTVVAGTLWPEVTEERAHGSLRTALWRLHRGRGCWCAAKGTLWNWPHPSWSTRAPSRPRP
ncbi:AfsR/SARP family transcriptional regulator [Streptomyces galilaeus]